MKKFSFILALISISWLANAQISPCDCSANVGSGNVNFSTLTWTGSGCPTAGSTSYTGNLCVSLDNGANLIMNKDFTINGGFGIVNVGNSTFTLPVNMDLTVTGSMGDNSNNNVDFIIDGNIIVGGTLYGNNNNGFTGTGSVTAGSLDFGNNTVCTNPANCTGIDWNISTCPPGDTFCNQVKALPVTLLFFDAKISGSAVILSWATATESNSSHFVIERSIDGKNFHEIASQNAAGNSVTKKEYTLIDKFPLVGRAYYRLKQVDFDGATEHFNMKFVDFTGKKGIAVYPNPVVSADGITISLNFSNDEKSFVKITDVSGHEVHKFSFSGTQTTVPFKPEQGTYLITVTSGRQTFTSRVVVR
jgi:hypothetical protein